MGKKCVSADGRRDAVDLDGKPRIDAEETRRRKRKEKIDADRSDKEDCPKKRCKGESLAAEGNGQESGKKKRKKDRKRGDGVDDDENASKENCCDGNGVKIVNGELLVSVSGRDCSKFQAFESFSSAKLPDDVGKCCSSFEKPSTIQAHSWPFLLDGRDFIGIAATGSGKTLAFGVPALVHVLNKRGKQKNGSKLPRCLVLSPTRELAQQISAVLEDAGTSCNVKVACLYGGNSKGPQYSSLRSGCDIIVATPGRLQDFVDEGVCKLDHVTYLVLDEADRMLDLGFEPAVRAIVSHIPLQRQTIMFSATWPTAVQKLAQEFIQDESPVK